ncbi:protein-tyrosine phosphatase-like protein [Limtongia smithiae]|uniref:protein-tyrosine phosphatase-like protein n=1 Tax=Limtongia smithiae TaxID=1125753 RepID=UPI0034CFD59E
MSCSRDHFLEHDSTLARLRKVVAGILSPGQDGHAVPPSLPSPARRRPTLPAIVPPQNPTTRKSFASIASASSSSSSVGTAADPRLSYVAALAAGDLSQKFLALDTSDSDRTRAAIRDDIGHGRWTLRVARAEHIRNRYSNVLPWDHNRIRLRVPSQCNDYINASPIVLHAPGLTPHSYIATQGPTRATVPHFWQMLAAETSGDTAVIVMLTPTHEGHREKCAKYWTESSTLGTMYSTTGFQCKLTLCSMHHDAEANCAVRTFTLDTLDGHIKTVYHLLFDSWGDFATPVPEHEAHLAHLCALAHRLNTSASPLIVHCSAGVGRTGTFVTIDFLLSCINNSTPVSSPILEDDPFLVSSAQVLYPCTTIPTSADDPIFDTVAMLRTQRMLMVQNITQYAFIYKILKAALLEP